MTWKPPQATVIGEPQGWTPPDAVAVSEPEAPTFGQRATEAAELWLTDPVQRASEQNDQAYDLAERHRLPVETIQRRQGILDQLYTREQFQDAAAARRAEKDDTGVSGYWQELVDATARGTARVGAAFKRAQAAITRAKVPGAWAPMDTPQMAQAREAKASRYERDAEILWSLARHPELAQREGKLNWAINVVGETLPYITATTVAYTVAGPMGGFAVGGLVEGHSAYMEAVEEGVESETAKAIGMAVGIVSGAIESVGGKMTEEVLERVIKARIKQKAAQGAALFATGTLVEAAEEAGQEIAAITGEEVYRDVDWNERIKRIGSAMAGGAFLGGTMRGAQIGASRLMGVEERPGLEDELTATIQQETGLPEGEARRVARDAIESQYQPEPQPQTEGQGEPQQVTMSEIVAEATKDLPMATELAGQGVHDETEAAPQEVPVVPGESQAGGVEMQSETLPGHTGTFRERFDRGDYEGMTREEAVAQSRSDTIAADEKQTALGNSAPNGTRVVNPDTGEFWEKGSNGLWQLYESEGLPSTTIEETRPGGGHVLPGWRVEYPAETPTVAESAPVAPEAPAGEGRQPWEMTKGEWSNVAQAVPLEEDVDAEVKNLRFRAKMLQGKVDEAQRGLDATQSPGGIERRAAMLDKAKKELAPIQQRLDEIREETRRRAIAVAQQYPGGMDISPESPWVTIRQHRKVVQEALAEGKPVPRRVLEEYQSESWADEALSKLEAEKAPVRPSEPREAEGATPTVQDSLTVAPEAQATTEGREPWETTERTPLTEAQKKPRRRYDGKSMEQAIRVAYTSASETGEPKYVYATAYGLRVEDSPPPVGQNHFVVTPQGELLRRVDARMAQQGTEALAEGSKDRRRKILQDRVLRGEDVAGMARTIEEFRGEPWADEALSTLAAETPPVRPSEPRTPEPDATVGREGVGQIEAEADEPTPEYKRTRKTELAKITKAIKSHPAYQQEVEAREALSETPTALGTIYVPKEYRGDVEAYAGEKGKAGANKALWDRITFDPQAGQHWDDAAAEVGWPDTFDGFMERFAMSVESGVDPDIAAVAENSGLPELETLAIKRDMLLANEPVGRINAEIEANLIEGAKGGTYQMSVEDAQVLANQLKIGGAEGEISVGAAAVNWKSRRRAIDKAQKLSKKESKPYYVIQQQGGRFMAKDAPPKKGYYTLVDMSRPISEQTTFIKQASETVEGAFDYGEHPKKSQRHMTALQRFKAKLKAKEADTEAIRQEIYDYIRSNVDRADQHRFLPLLNKVTSKRQTKTNLKELGKAIAETEQLLRYNDKRDAVQEFIDTVKDIRKTYRAGIKQFGKLDKFTRDRVQTLLGDIDPQTLSARKQADLESLGRYLQGIAQRLRDGLITEAEAKEAAMNIPASRLAGLSRIGKKPLREMETGDIREMTKMLKQYVSNFELKKQLRGRRRAIALAEADAGIRREMVPRQKFVPTDDTTARAGRGILGRFFTTESAHLDTLVEFLTANDSEMARKIFDEDLTEGARVRDGLERKALMRIRERLAEIGLTAKDFRRMTELREVSIGGETVKITAEDLMALYRHSRDEYNLRALLDAPGYRIGNKNTKPFTGVEELYEALDQLSDQERAYADLYAEINRTVTAPAVNKASVELEGFELADNPTYWPIRYVQAVRAAGGTSDIAIEDFGRYQPRVGGTGRLRIVPYSHEMLRCIQEDATYAGMMIPLHNARTILNQRDLQDYARDIGQKDTLEAIIQILRNIQGNPSSASIAEKLGRGVLNRYAQSVLSLRISTIGTQVGSLPAALAEIDPKYAVGVVPSQERLRKLEEHSDELWKRWSSRHITIEMGNIAASHAPEMLFFETHPWAEKPLKALVASDRQTIGLIAGMVENEIKATRPDLTPGSDAYWDAVARRTEQVTRRTQPMWDMLNRSNLGADPGVWKRSVLMFRSALEAQYNILLRAHNRYAKSDKSAAEKARLAKAHASVFASAGMVAIWKRLLKLAMAAGATAALVALGVKDPTEDDDESAAEVAKDLAIDTGQNMLGLLPGGNLFGQVIRNTVEVAAGESTWGREPYDTPIGDLINGIGTTAFVRTPKLARALATEDWETATDEAIRIMDDGLDLTAKLTGMPYSGPRSEIVRPLQKAAKEDRKSEYTIR